MICRSLLALSYCALASTPLAAQGTSLTPDQRIARENFRELIELNTSFKAGSTAPAARAVAHRFLAGGFPARDVRVIGPVGDKDPNVIVRMPGSSDALAPILLLAHLDVVEAL